VLGSIASGSWGHHLSRRRLAAGHDVKLMPARTVKPCLKGHKTDFRDAEAIAEAARSVMT
jgi:transposase